MKSRLKNSYILVCTPNLNLFPVAFLCFVTLAGLLLPSCSAAGHLQTAEQWITTESDHFIFIAEESLRPQIPGLVRECEEAYADLGPLFHWSFSEKPTILFSDGNDRHNGWATSLSHPTLFVLAAPPRNNSYLAGPCNHRRRTTYHELTHLLQTDANHGIVAACNSVFGRIWAHSMDPLTLLLGILTLPPVNATPSWYKEGTAIWAETQFAGPGRGHSAELDAFFRTAVDQNRLLQPEKWHLRTPWWPHGNTAYIYGMKALEDAALYPAQGKPCDPNIPGALGAATAHAPLAGWFNSQAKTVGDRNFVSIARDIQMHEMTFQLERITHLQQRPMIRLFRQSPPGVQITEPTWTPDGNLWVVAQYDTRRSRLARVDFVSGTLDPVGPRVSPGWTQTAIDPATGEIYYTRLDGKNGTQWRSFLYRYNPLTDESVRVPQLDRIMDMTISPTGNLLVVRRLPHGDILQEWQWSDSSHTKLIQVNGSDLSNSETLDKGDVLSSPVCLSEHRYGYIKSSPDGCSIRQYNNGKQNIRFYNVPGQSTARTVTVDSRGRLMLITDFNGVFNLYQLSDTGDEWLPVTHTLGGVYDCAFSPDGNQIGLIGMDADGFFVSVVDRDSLQPMNEPVPKLSSPWRLPVSKSSRLNRSEGDTRPLTPITEYYPLHNLRMDYWAPWLNWSSGYSSWGLATQWTDRSLSHTVFGTMGVESDHDEIIGAVNWSYSAMRPGLEISLSRQIPLYSGLIQDIRQRWFDLEESRWKSVLSARWDWAQADYFATVRTGWAGVYRSVFDEDIWQEAWQAGRLGSEPLDGFESSFWVTSGINTATVFPESLSLEDGFMGQISMDVTGEVLGSDLNRIRLRTDLAGWWSIPFLDNHVLKGSASFGASFGDELAQGAFTVGGYDNLGSGNPPGMESAMTLRGYQGNVQVGDRAARLAFSYRFPLYRHWRSVSPRSIHYGTQLMVETFFEIAAAWNDHGDRDWYQAMGLELNVGSVWFSSIDLSPGIGFSWMPDYFEKNVSAPGEGDGDWAVYLSIKSSVSF